MRKIKREVIIKRMYDMGLTNAELANRAGLKYDMVYAFIRGYVDVPTVLNLSKILDVLGLDFDEILIRGGDE